MKKYSFLLVVTSVFILFVGLKLKASGPYDGMDIKFHVSQTTTARDTVPLEDRDGDFLTDKSTNPFDLEDPKDIEKEITYDPETGLYVLREKIGDMYFRAPTYMTYEEYVAWQSKQDERDYFNRLSGMSEGNRSKSGILDPIASIDLKKRLIDRLFGGNQITIEPQGNVDLTFGWDYQNIENPNIPERAQTVQGFNFDMDIKTNVQGKIGDKMDLGFNWDNNSTFGFDNQVKLEYDSEKWSEDEIVKKIEAGNISFPLRGSLIQGAQSLLGVKTELQFGHLKVTGVVANQQSNQEQLTIQSGGTLQEFEVFPDDYDENRHFFLDHFNRENYEAVLENMPFINTPYKVVNLQVWVTNSRRESEQLRDIAALADLGVGDEANLTNPIAVDVNTVSDIYKDYTKQFVLPDNSVNSLQDLLRNDDATRSIINTATNLKSKYGFVQSKDFEVLKARQLSASEYTFHPELGFISLNVRLRPNQVLAVAYQYTYTYNGGEIYQVGEFADDVSTQDSSKVIFTKLLKSSVQKTNDPNWRLMMKNVYPLRALQVSAENFKFDIFYENNKNGSLTRYIPIGQQLSGIPLLDIFNLDNLNAQNDPQPDGIFDFVPGVTILPKTGSIIFPVLEPFGSSLREIILKETGDPKIADSLAYQELYDTTIIGARQSLAKNRFIMKGEYKSSISSEINLGAFNIPKGSVTVRAGSKQLIENVDYEIEYGTGRLRILNDAYLQGGIPINVSFENNSLFGYNRKSLVGTRLDYQVNKHLDIGGTYLHLFERPIQQKVNIGDDPISNRVFGFDMNYNNELPWLTRMLDKLPFYSTSAMSSINSQLEMAYLLPGHAKVINNSNQEKGGIVLVDDFEGASSGIPLGSFNFNLWQLASTPITRKEAQIANSLEYGANRARINWYVLDGGFLNNNDNSDPYTRLVGLQELFEKKSLTRDQYAYLRTFDLSYYPNERGPYNFDPPNGSAISSGSFWDEKTQTMQLKEPETRWAGIMRYLPNNDFQALNVEYIEFWMLNPFMENKGNIPADGETGEIHFHLGNVSEDILKDNLQFYENGMEAEDPVPYQTSNWGKVPLIQPKSPNFDEQYIEKQDVGLDGLTDTEEFEKHQAYVNEVLSKFPTAKIQGDVANDNYVGFKDDSKYNVGSDDIRTRLTKFNNPQGNTPVQAQNSTSRGKYSPDIEDMNNNSSLDQGENYYDYTIELTNDGGEIKRDIGNDFIREVREIKGPKGAEKWYRFQIPINSPSATIGDIEGLRSIQFVRMIVNGFKEAKTFRMGNLELIRNQWRRIDTPCAFDGPNPTKFSIDAVSIEENSQKTPFNYTLPPGVNRPFLPSGTVQTQQNERSLALKFKGLPQAKRFENTPVSCDIALYKLTRLDMRLYEELQLFIHGESFDDLADGDLSVFIKLGKDFSQNFYEYEIPISLSRDPLTNASNVEEIWKEVNKMKLQLKKLSNLKLERNKNGFDATKFYTKTDPDYPGHTLAVIGNPSLGLVKGIQIGVRNNSENAVQGEVWLNELRLVGLEERGGFAGLVQTDIQLADLGSVSASGAYSTIGYGAIDQRLADRSQEEVVEYNVGGNIELSKLLPGKLPISLPLFAQHSNVIKTPRWDPYDLDIQVKDKIRELPDKKEEVEALAIDKTTINTVNLTNVRVHQTDRGKTAMPWDITNLSASYAYTQTKHQDPIIKEDNIQDHAGSLDYAYSRTTKFWEPFKSIKNKNLKLIKNINFNFLPNRFSVKNSIKRYHSVRTYRLPDFIDYTFYDKRFTWDRNYTLNWDFTKGLQFSFDAYNKSIIDELRQVGIGTRAQVVNERGNEVAEIKDVTKNTYRDYAWENVKRFGRAKDYGHNMTLQYALPTRDIPFLDWTSVRANVSTSYVWDGASLNVDTLGNIVQNTQNRNLTATFNFDRLYRKSKYLSKIDKGRQRTSSRRARNDDLRRKPSDKNKKEKGKKKKDRQVSIAELVLVRPLMSLRTIKFVYKENFGTTIPGIVRNTNILGLDSKFDAPGWAFVFGGQPDLSANNANNWLYRGANNGWFTESRFLNKEVLQNRDQDIDVKVDLEVYKDLDIDLTFKKRYSENHIEEFKKMEDGYQQLALRNLGSFEVNYYTLGTLFNDDYKGLFSTFQFNRARMSQRLPNKAGAGSHGLDPEYAEGYGRQSTDVLVPSFLATYTGNHINNFSTTFVQDVSALNYIPAPTWNLTYNGLSKLPWFDEIFSNVSIRHGYKSILRVNQFKSDPKYNFGGQGAQFLEKQENTLNYYSRFDIPQMVISEEFSPIIGIDVRTKSDFNFNLEYRKSRDLQMDFYAKELVESRAEEFVVGTGFVFEDVNIPFLTGKKSSKKSSKKKKNTKKKKGGIPGFGSRVESTKGNDLTFKCDFAYRDDLVYNHSLDLSTRGQATRGVTSYSLNPSLEYDVNDNLTLRLFFDYSRSKPKTTLSYPLTNANGGVVVRFNLR